MDKRLFESSEFYTRRYNNFSTMVILPIFLLVLLLGSFCFYGKREMTIKTVGEIQPVKIISEIQSTTSNEIVETNLEENQLIHVGDILVRYKDETTKEQLNYLQEQLSENTHQKKQLELLKDGIEQEKSTFPENDKYGYSQILADYFSQRQALIESNEKENADINSQNEAIATTKAAIDNEIQQTQDKVSGYSTLAQAIQNGNTTFDKNSELYPIFDSYRQQIKDVVENKGVKKQILAEIQTTIDQLNTTISSYQAQRAGAGAYIQQSSTLDEQLASLKSQQLLSADKELTTVNTKIAELESNLTLQKELDKRNTITSSSEGIIHLNEEVKGKNYIGEGTTIAQVYPTIQLGESVNLVAYVDSQDIASIHKEDKIRFTSKKENAESFELACQITKIGASPEKTERGNYFKVTAKTIISKNNQADIRYGLQGNFTIITGKKTYFDYYKDKLFNKN
ncbi:bacteriocin secretion accessory protein [Enterococcus sp. MJM12]|uniref:Bacteriocin secretion accessory protein n=1 Tax=Candidatus Enterococcus myersii TaxID=2815322 RepID=A0ABS3H6U6_9ENTE|nr:bacteriocin secretion accessory protein [Enterococcus sp. MJM12]MBO0449180.1 bacteriocin secretion accessory protein [Enterococcus sp. MJM12]